MGRPPASSSSFAHQPSRCTRTSIPLGPDPGHSLIPCICLALLFPRHQRRIKLNLFLLLCQNCSSSFCGYRPASLGHGLWSATKGVRDCGYVDPSMIVLCIDLPKSVLHSRSHSGCPISFKIVQEPLPRLPLLNAPPRAMMWCKDGLK